VPDGNRFDRVENLGLSEYLSEPMRGLRGVRCRVGQDGDHQRGFLGDGASIALSPNAMGGLDGCATELGYQGMLSLAERHEAMRRAVRGVERDAAQISLLYATPWPADSTDMTPGVVWRERMRAKT